MNTKHARTLAIGALLLPLVVVTAGCQSVIDQVVHKEQSFSYDSRDALIDGWKQEADWVPADAAAITGTASTESTNASIVLRSAEELDSTLCAEVTRQSGPVYDPEGAPDDVYKKDTAFACGDWTVISTDDGWYGWTPNHPDEAAQSPAG